MHGVCAIEIIKLCCYVKDIKVYIVQSKGIQHLQRLKKLIFYNVKESYNMLT